MKKLVIVCMLCLAMITPSSYTLAAESEELDGLIRNQEEILAKLNEKKMQKIKDEYTAHLKSLEESQQALRAQIAELKKQLNAYDSASAIESLAARINGFEGEMAKQLKEQNKLLSDFKKEQEQPKLQEMESLSYARVQAARPTAQYLTNPAPKASANDYMQDAVNAQNAAEMCFAYAPNQIYKIYCKVGYLTDLRFKAGEKITFVGGGDTAKWMIDTAETGDISHLYIKPINQNATTNLIVNTTNHTYQIIVVAGEWYNPMVSWSYPVEEQMAKKLKKQKDAEFYTERSMHVSNVEHLYFKYKVKGKKDWAPTMIFDDGRKTYIKFEKELSGTLPILFIKERYKKEISMVNYRIKDNCFIVDKVFERAELKMSEDDTVKIVRK